MCDCLVSSHLCWMTSVTFQRKSVTLLATARTRSASTILKWRCNVDCTIHIHWSFGSSLKCITTENREKKAELLRSLLPACRGFRVAISLKLRCFFRTRGGVGAQLRPQSTILSPSSASTTTLSVLSSAREVQRAYLSQHCSRVVRHV